jgi:Flp pilus assembly protein TadD
MLSKGILALSLSLVLQTTGPGGASHWDAEGLARLQQGQVSEAERCFRKALEINAQDVDALNNLAVIFRRQGKPGEAVELLRRGVQAQPGNATFTKNLACVGGGLRNCSLTP